MLAYYAGRLNSVELNTTFYGNPSEDTVAAWAGAVPPGFVFAVKAHRIITYSQRAVWIKREVKQFARLMDGLEDHLGPVLLQLPPTAKYERKRLERLLKLIPKGWRVAFQFRHASWFTQEPMAAVEEAGAAVCHADGEPEPGPLGRGAFTYLKLRREEYSETDLDAWAERIGGDLAAGRDVFAYFKHETWVPPSPRNSLRGCKHLLVPPPGRRYNPGSLVFMEA
jgi:uncharacterized protein YecE (DUF72 family)